LLETRPPPNNELLDLVGSIYASALEPVGMTQALRAVSATVRGTFAQLLTVHRNSGRVLNSLISDGSPALEAAHREYLSEWAAFDPRAEWLASLPSGAVARCHDHFDDAFVGANSFYQDYLIAHGFRWALAGVLESGADTTTVVVGVRAIDAPPFEDWAADSLRQLLPHVRQAYLIRSRLDRHAAAGASAVEMLRALPVPCLFTDQAGRCIERNRAFDDALEALPMRLALGRVRFADTDMQSAWEAALSDTHATAVEHTFTAGPPGARQWQIHLIPLHWRLLDGDLLDNRMIMAVFQAGGAAQAQPAVGSFTPAARLTQAELEVATGLLHGLSAKVIAKERGASVNTVRSQIMSILDKTGFKSQRELIAAVGTSTLGAGAFGASSLPRASQPKR
jgi:DNA-binding CsgD family transcriptional regulator